jgi:hypothetical protein
MTNYFRFTSFVLRQIFCDWLTFGSFLVFLLGSLLLLCLALLPSSLFITV